MSTDPTYEQRMNDAMLDSFDEELEMEFDDNRMDSLIDELARTGDEETELGRNFYFKELFRLQGELVKLQDWVVHKKLKVVVPVSYTHLDVYKRQILLYSLTRTPISSSLFQTIC